MAGSTTEDARLLANLRRLRDDYPRYAVECLKIRDKDGLIIPFVLNSQQRFLHEKLEAQRARTGKVRAIIGKGRQTTASTYVGGRFYHRTSLRKGLRTFILTHSQPGTDALFEMVTRFHEHTPLRPSTGASNEKELYFDKLDSGYAVGVASNKGTGRSQTIQMLHWSEVAFSANAEAHQAGVVQTVPDRPGTEIIKESTGNGPTGLFHADWQQAEAGIGDYIAVFIPWFVASEYAREPGEGFTLDEEERDHQRLYSLSDAQMCWRRAKILELKDPRLFKQEYPASPHEMFQYTAQNSFIDPELVMAARRNNLEGIGPLVVGVDPGGRGLNGRFSVSWRRGRKVLKAESRSGIGTQEQLAWLRDIIDQDQPDAMFMDVGGGGDKLYDILVSWGAVYEKVLKLVNFGDPAHQEVTIERDGTRRGGPYNRRAQMWSRVLDWLGQPGGSDLPDSDSLQSDLVAPGFHYRTQDGKLLLESKEEMKRRGIRSPDEGDSVALTFAEPVKARPTREPVKRQQMQTSGEPSQGWMGT